MYSPTLGRFVTTDPIGFQAGDVNLYRFVENNPANMVDPSGLFGVSAAVGIPPLLLAADPPKEPKLPTSKDLGWNDFKKVDKLEVGDAFIAYDLKYNTNDIKTTSKANGCEFVGTATLQVKFRADFNRDRSRVLNGRANQALLLHERLHLAIAEYFTDKATRNFKPNPFTVNAKGDTAEEAEKNAKADLIKVLDTKVAELYKTLQTIQGLYDKEAVDKMAKNGFNEKGQEDWSKNYMSKVNELVKTLLKWEN